MDGIEAATLISLTSQNMTRIIFTGCKINKDGHYVDEVEVR
jgi:hypothetical protein